MSQTPGRTTATTLTWDNLVTSALLGTARQPVDPAALPGDAGRIGAGLPDADPAARLLDAAALLTVARRAGGFTRTLRVPPSPAPPDARRSVSAAAAARLADLLTRAEGGPDALLTVWLRTAGEHGYHAPAAQLPALLDLAVRRREYVGPIAAVLGERGRWLARHRPDWAGMLPLLSPANADSTADASHGDDTWTHGTSAQRRAWLLALRRRDPAAARALLLAADWKREKGEDRAEFVRALRHELSAADEEILERAVADRRQDVRMAAAALLSRLPDSAFQRRVAERALRCVRVERRRMRRTLVITLPEPGSATDPDPFRPCPHGVGPAAWLLQELIGSTPLHRWTDELGMGPAELVTTPITDDLAPAVHDGWIAAARLQRSADWATALLTVTEASRSPELVAVLPPTARLSHAAAALDRAAGRDDAKELNLITALLQICPDPWPPALAAAVLRWLAADTKPAHWNGASLIRQARAAMPSDAATESSTRAAADRLAVDDPWRPQILSVADALLYRRHMIEELR